MNGSTFDPATGDDGADTGSALVDAPNVANVDLRKMAVYETFTARALLDMAKKRLLRFQSGSQTFGIAELAAARELLEMAKTRLDEATSLVNEAEEVHPFPRKLRWRASSTDVHPK